jgi:hypothetical protein
VGPARGEPEQLLLLSEDGADQRHVGQVGSAPVRIVEDPALPASLLLVQHGRDRVWHRAEVDGNVLGLHHQLSARVE